jgi:hypothetical protein
MQNAIKNVLEFLALASIMIIGMIVWVMLP